jgi:hypothetical protein
MQVGRNVQIMANPDRNARGQHRPKWNDAHSGLGRGGQGHVPTSIEPVTVTVKLRSSEGAKSVSAAALDGSGKPIGDPSLPKRLPPDGRSQWELPSQHGRCCQ